MSGPIIRRYGFPNFEKIFGDRELKHGNPVGTTPPTEPIPDTQIPKPTRSDGPIKEEKDLSGS